MMKRLILYLFFLIPSLAISQTYTVEEQPSYLPNQKKYKVTKKNNYYENPQLYGTNSDNTVTVKVEQQFPVYNVDWSGFANARMNEWRNMRARRYQKYRYNPTKKTTLKLYRANKVLGLPLDAGIRQIDFQRFIVPRFK